METKPGEISSSKMFGGYNKRYKHFSPTLGCSMTFYIYFPPSPSPSHKFPVCHLPFLFLLISIQIRTPISHFYLFFIFSYHLLGFLTVQVVSFEYFIFLYIPKFLVFCVYPTGRLVLLINDNKPFYYIPKILSK